MTMALGLVALLAFFAWILYLGLASVGHRFLIHQFYVSRLLKLFEYGQKDVEEAERRRRLQFAVQRPRPQSQPPSRQNSYSSFESWCDSDYDSDEFATSDSDLNSDQQEVPSSFKPTRSMSLRMAAERRSNQLKLDTVMDFVRLGIEAIKDDEVTKRFDAEELRTWNLLTRTDKYRFGWSRLTLYWLVGVVFRYGVLFPLRCWNFIIGNLWLVTVTFLIGLMPEGHTKRTVYHYMSIMCFRILSRVFSAVITFHNRENRAKPGGICVANHTSPIDMVVLHCDNAYALVGQKHQGFLGFLQRALSRATHHIFFDRFESQDRKLVLATLRQHAADRTKLPILIFPEGTCINNSAVMMFKKGSFETGATIYPVAIKYDARFGDPFWNSTRYGYLRYLLNMMTSWAIVCDVWYLPPMTREPDESAIAFANRVKAKIAARGGLVDLDWDGQLKRQRVKPELVKQQQLRFVRSLTVSDLNNNNQDGGENGSLLQNVDG